MGRWRISTLIVVGVSFAAYFFLSHAPLSLALIIAGSLVALVTTLSDPKNAHLKTTWAVAAAAIAIVGGINGYQNGLQAQKQAKASNDLLKTKTDEIASLTKQSLDLARTNSQLSGALIKKTDIIVTLSKDSVDAVTGGSDFVIVDIIPFPVDKGGVALIASASGKNVIRDVFYTMNEGRPPNILTEADLNDIITGRLRPGTLSGQLGNVVPHRTTPVGVMHPSLQNGAYYNITLFALNGYVNETLELRYETDKPRWNRELTITRGNRVIRHLGWIK